MFEHLVITAPDTRRASQFEELIRRRLRSGLYPREITFHVVPDPPGRIGSGGATILALRSLIDKLGVLPERFFEEQRVVLLHGGGESRRLPMYAPEGKLFAPVPLSTSAIDPPVLLDLHITAFLAYPWTERARDVPRGELVVASGDAIVRFDGADVSVRQRGVRGFPVPASFDVGSRHGVFQLSDSGDVVDFHQKRDPEFLEQRAAIDADHCAMDSGVFAFDPPAAGALVGLADAEVDGTTLHALLASGQASIDLYREIVMASVARESPEQLAERVQAHTNLPRPAVDALHRAMRDHPLGACAPEACRFSHLGTIGDYRRGCADLAEIKPFYSRGPGEISGPTGELCAINASSCEIRVESDSGVFVENGLDAWIKARGSNMIVGVRGSIPGLLPDGFCVDQRRLSAAQQVSLVYHEADSWKPVDSLDRAVFCARPLSQWLSERGLTLADIGGDAAPLDLLAFALFVIDPDPAKLRGYWSLPEDPVAWGAWFREAARVSLREANERSDPLQRDDERREIRRGLLRKSILSGDGWREASSADVRLAIVPSDVEALTAQLTTTSDPLLNQYRRQTLAALLDNGPTEQTRHQIQTPHAPHSVWESQRWDLDRPIVARSPARLDLAGGWSDTPPYTNRFGGHVVNIAVDLDGKPPIEVRIRRTNEPVIAVRSIDANVHARIAELDEIGDFARPGEALSLVWAALWLSGLRQGALRGRTLCSILTEIGGIELSTHSALPTGSGLGTSSILGATILAALHRAMGMPLEQSDLLSLVLELERLMTTGGGWQDQVGGVVGGVKSATTEPGLSRKPEIEQLPPALFLEPRYAKRMTLYYTGITRLAKNILEEVVNQVNDATSAYLFTTDEIRRHAGLARDAILHKDLDALASVLNLTWRSKCLVHESTTNPMVESLLDDTREHWMGASLLGAGGGGFVLFLSPDERSADSLREALRSRHATNGAGIHEMSLNLHGLTVQEDE